MFTTNEQERVSNGEFLDSGSTTWCFFEEGAFGPDGELTQPKELSINKIGHAQHDLDDEFERFAYQPRLAEVAADLGLVDARALQSMYIFKQPLIGGEVGCHQDATFLYTDPMTVTGFWFAIEDATLDNGCLWAAPGGHEGPLRQVFKRNATDDGTIFEPLDDTPLPAPPPVGDTLVPLEVPAGTMVVLHGRLPHWSAVNTSPTSRHAYSLHCISGAADYPDVELAPTPSGHAPAGARQRGLMTTPGLLARAPKVLLHDHLDGGLRPETVIELASEYGYDDLPTTDVDDLATWFNRGAKRNDLVLYLETFAHTVGVMQDRDAIERVAFECAQDLAADGVVYAEVRFAPELSTEKGLTLDEVMEAVLDGYRRGSAGTDLTIYAIVSAMRTAARSYEIAELAVRFRDAGVVGFDIAGAEAGYPPTRHLDAFQYIQRENFHTTIHAGEAFGLPSIWEALQFCGAARLGHGVRIVDDIDSANGSGTEKLGRLATFVRDRRVPLELCPTSNVNTGRGAHHRRPSHRDAAAAAIPRHPEHRQPVDERHVDDQGDGAALRSVRLEPGRLRMADGQRHEVGVRTVPRASSLDQRIDQAAVRDPARRTLTRGGLTQWRSTQFSSTIRSWLTRSTRIRDPRHTERVVPPEPRADRHPAASPRRRGRCRPSTARSRRR